MPNSPNNSHPLPQWDYEYMVLNSLAELTNDSNGNFEFSVSQIAKNLKEGNSINRTMFAIKVLLDDGLIGNSGSPDVEEENFGQLIQDDDQRFYITKLGLEEFDERTEADAKIDNFLVTEVSPRMRLLAYIYANTRSAIDLFCRFGRDKLSTEKMEVVSELAQKGLIKAFLFELGWTITEEGRQLLASEAKAKALSLDRYADQIGEMDLDEIFNVKNIAEFKRGF